MIHFFEKNNISLHISEFEVICNSNSQRGNIICLLKHKLLGKILIINNEIQHIEAWTPIYHESVIHIPISFIPNLKTALVIGGGSFFAAKELLKYKSIEKIVMVDYDSEVISIANDNYDHVKEILSDKRFILVIEDITSYIYKCNEKFDFIVNDAVDLLEMDSKLLDKITSKLSKFGICSDLIYRHIYESIRGIKTVSLLREKYNTAFSLIVVPEYPGIMHLLTMWGNTELLGQNAIEIQNNIQIEWAKNINTNPCLIYDPRFIKYYLHLPPYLKKYILNI